MYEALFQALADKDYIESVWTWGYWWLEDDFNREDGNAASFDKSSLFVTNLQQKSFASGANSKSKNFFSKSLEY